jgi:hypothetical protein
MWSTSDTRHQERHLHCAGRREDHRAEWMGIVYLWFSVPESVHCSRASDLHRPGPKPGPGGSSPRRTKIRTDHEQASDSE